MAFSCYSSLTSPTFNHSFALLLSDLPCISIPHHFRCISLLHLAALLVRHLSLFYLAGFSLDHSSCHKVFKFLSFHYNAEKVRFVAFSMETTFLLPQVSLELFSNCPGLTSIYQDGFNIILNGFSCVDGDGFICSNQFHSLESLFCLSFS